MKKLNELQSYLTRLRGLMLTLIILCSIGIGNTWSATSRLTLKSSTSQTSGVVISSVTWTFSDITFANTNNACVNATSGTVTITPPSGSTVTQITVKKTGNAWAGAAQLKLYVGSSATAHTTLTSSSNATTNISITGTDQSASSFTFSNTTSKNCWVEYIEITYTAGGGGSTPVTGVTVSPTSKSIIPGETFTITPTVAPAGATDKVVSWTSGTPAAATVSSSGVVTGVAAGSSTITCTTHDGSFTATCAVTVRGVTLQALDEDGNAIAGGGPGAPTRSGTTITAAANAGNYVFKQWDVTNATPASTTTTPTTISNPTGAVTVTAVYYKPITITYKANNTTFTTQTYARGGTLAFPASNPDGATYSCTGKTFMGWVGEANKNYSHASTAPTYATAGGSVTTAATYYAVFADRSGSGEITWDKVTSAPSDWSGDYVIVRADGANAMISDFHSGTSGEFKSAAVTINAAGTQITSTPTDKMIWTVAKNGNNAQYSFKNKSTNTYAQITGTSSTNAALNASAVWFTIESTGTSGVWDVASVANSARCFAWYGTNSSFRTYAKSSYNTGRLFKKSGEGYTYSNYETNCCTPPASPLSITGSNTVAMDATLSPGTSGGNGGTVTWSVEAGTGTATINPSTGVLTPGSVGTVTIKAHQDANSKCAQDAQKEITITAATVNVTSVSVAPTSKAIVPGETFTITPTVLPANATDKSVSWNSSATSYATVTSAGVVSGVAAGSSTITCTTTDGGFTATCATTVYGVTIAVEDEDGTSLSGVGKPTISRSGVAVTTAAAGNYVFKEWSVTNATLSGSTSTGTTITSPTGAVTVKAIYRKPINVTWKVGDDNASGGTTQVAYNTKITTLPTKPGDDDLGDCTEKFMGWSATNIGSTPAVDAPSDLFDDPSDAGVVALTSDQTYYAVFASVTSAGVDPISITSFAAGDYYLIDYYSDNYYAMSGTGTSKVNQTVVTSIVSYNSTTGQLTITDASSLTAANVYTISGSTSAAKIYNDNSEAWVTTQSSGTSFSTSEGTNVVTKHASAPRFAFTYASIGTSGNRAVLYRYSQSGWCNYAESNMGASGYGTGYMWLVPAGAAAEYGNYVTKCCTEVAARSGSVTMGSTSATVSWSVSGTAASKISSWDVTCKVTSSGASAGTKGSITGSTTKTVEFTGLNPNTGYTFHILGTSNDDAYCDVDDELTGTTECQTPSSLSIASTGNKWDFCAGETMTLTVSGTNISGSATYQWQKHNGSTWVDIDGAMNVSYSTTMAANKAGQYRCTVTNPGSGSCDATTDGVWVRVWQLHLGDDDIDFTYVSGTTGSNSTVHLNSDTHYEFKLKDNNGGWFGLNSKTVTATISAFALNGTGANVNVTSGLEGNYTFTINYSDKNNPTIAVTYPTGNQAAGKKIWFDKSIIDGWNTAGTSNIYYRIGHTTYSQSSNSWTLVPGTDRFYEYTTTAFDGFAAWQIANNYSQDNGSTSIYVVNGGHNITKSIVHQKYVVGNDGVTIVPGSSTGSSDGCTWYAVTKTDGMLTHTATITTPTNGTIQLEYTDVNSAAQTKTATTAGLAHRTLIKATATPAPGYQLTTFTVTPEGGAARSLVATNGQANNDTLEINSTYAATFSAKTITITWNANGGNTPSPTESSYTYNGSTVSLATVTHATKLFAGWWTDPSAGTQITEIGTTNKPTDDVTYYAHWVDGNTVYFHPGVGSVTPTSATQTSIGGAVDIPTPTIDCDGWSFAGWNIGSELAETTTNPEASLQAAGSAAYVPASTTVHMYAVWKKNFGGGTGTVTNTFDWEAANSAWSKSSMSNPQSYSDYKHGGSYSGNVTAGGAYIYYLTKLESPLSIDFYYTRTSNNDNSGNYWCVQTSTNGSSWTTRETSLGNNSLTKGTYEHETVDLSSYSNIYVKLLWSNGSSSAGGNLDDVTISYTGTIADAWKWTSTAEDYGCVSANQVKTPVISPNTEAQTGDVSVTITCATDGATIRYTTDGTNPTSSSGTVYSGAFTVSCSATVKAIAYKATMDDSEIASQAYTITVPTPTFSLAEGTYYDANQSVTLSLPTAHTGTVIKYTTNGDDPTSSSATYSSAITVTEGTTTIKAIGYNSTCGTSSSVASATYIVRFGTDYTLVTDANDLMAGDQVVIISADAGTSSKYAISTTISSNKRTSTSDYNINAGLTTAKIYPAVGVAATVQVFTLGGEPGAWTFHETTNDGYLNCPSAGKLTNTANVSNSNKWTISIASNIATIHNNEVDATIKSNTGSNHVFAAYAPATENVQLVKLYSIPNPDPVIKIDADLSAFSACRGSASDYQSFYISGKNLDGSIVLSNVAPLAGYEFCLTSGGTYTATLELTPVSKTVAKTQVFVRLAAGATAGTKNGNLNAAVSANSLSTNIAVTGSVSVADTYTDQVHNTVVANQCGDYYAPSCPDASSPADESCVETHFKFMGWISEADKNSSGVKDDAWYIAHLITAGTPKTANGTNYYAVWAKEED